MGDGVLRDLEGRCAVAVPNAALDRLATISFSILQLFPFLAMLILTPP